MLSLLELGQGCLRDVLAFKNKAWTRNRTCGMLTAACRGPARRSPMCGRARVHRLRLKPLLARAAASRACCTSASATLLCIDPGRDTYAILTTETWDTCGRGTKEDALDGSNAFLMS